MTLIAIVKNEDIVALQNRSNNITENEVNEQDEYGNTALHYAMKTGNWYIIKFLLDNKANMLIENKEGISALQMAKPDSIKRICVETEMKEKPKKDEKEEKEENNATSNDENNNIDDEIVQNMGFSSNTIRLKNGIEKHAQLISNRLKETKNRLSKILVNVCNEQKCYDNANCLYKCGHIVFCMKHGIDYVKKMKKCPYCDKPLDETECYEIVPII